MKLLLAIALLSTFTFAQSQTIELRRTIESYGYCGNCCGGYNQLGYPYGSFGYNRNFRSSYRSFSCGPFYRLEFKLSNDDTWRSVGLAGDGLKPYLMDSPEALAELKKYKTKLIALAVTSVGGIVYLASYAVAEISRPVDMSNVNQSHVNSNFGGLGTAIVAVGTLEIVAIICAATSGRHLRNAIDLYNHRASHTGSTKPKFSIGSAQLIGIRASLQF